MRHRKICPRDGPWRNCIWPPLVLHRVLQFYVNDRCKVPSIALVPGRFTNLLIVRATARCQPLHCRHKVFPVAHELLHSLLDRTLGDIPSPRRLCSLTSGSPLFSTSFLLHHLEHDDLLVVFIAYRVLHCRPAPDGLETVMCGDPPDTPYSCHVCVHDWILETKSKSDSTQKSGQQPS